MRPGGKEKDISPGGLDEGPEAVDREAVMRKAGVLMWIIK